MTTSPRSRLLHSAALIIPAGAILVLGVLAGGPSTAPAGAHPAPALHPTILTPAAPRPAADVARALEWLSTQRLPAPGQSPMVRGAEPARIADAAAAPEPDPADALPPEGPQPPQAIPVPALKLTALLRTTGPSGEAGVALIDGRICGPGHPVAPGWRLTRVDPDDDLIEIACDDGRVERVRLRRPGNAAD